MWGDIPTWIGAIATAAAAGFGIDQLRGLNKTLRMNGLMAVLQIEGSLQIRNARMLDISEKIDIENAKAKPNAKRVAGLQKHLAAAVEQYLNAIDRLAFCIRHEFVPEKDWQAEYREYFSNAIRDFKHEFGPGTIYRNVMYMNDRWQDSGKRLK